MHALASPFNSTNVRNSIAQAWMRLQGQVAATLAPHAALERAVRLFLTPPRFEHTPRERELLATGTPYFVDAPHARLAAWRFGGADRPAVLLSHGWGGRGAQFRAFVPALLDAGFQAIAFDHAAHGHSSGEESSLLHFTRDVEAVARELESRGVRVAGAVGHSLGAPALAGWLRGAGRAVRVVLVSPPHSIVRYSGHFARALGLPRRLRHAMRARLEGRLGVALSEFELPRAVEGIESPVLVIHDAHDREVPLASGLAVARAWKGARFVRTEGLGHRAILRDPGVVADALGFLTDAVRFNPPPAPGEAAGPATPAPIY